MTGESLIVIIIYLFILLWNILFIAFVVKRK